MWDTLQLFFQFVVKTVLDIMGDQFTVKIIVELLENFAKMTENTLDDEIVQVIKRKLVLKQE